ncbi:MAG: DUF177 domain-containing protein [Alphaproteobacteria bacterium]|nr:DUF177 domain-containing protein [Alphaproteobacteria bacterium]
MCPKKSTLKLPEPEWSVWVKADEIPADGKQVDLSPDASQLPLIAQRIGVLSLDSLRASLSLSKSKGGVMVHVTGTLWAEIVQSCVVTLEPIKSKIQEDFEAWFADQEHVILFEKAQRDVLTKKEMMDLPILEEKEDPEPLEDGKVNLGELVVQYLCLAVNPFPHNETAEQQSEKTPIAHKGRGAQEPLRPNPFAALKNWRPKD